LTAAEFQNRYLAGERDFTKQPLDKLGLNGGLYENCDFRRASLQEMMCFRASFVNCNFDGAVLRRSRLLETHIDNSTVVGCDLFASSFLACRITGSSFANSDLNTTEVRDTPLDICNFSYARLLRTTFANVAVRAVDFSGATLSGTTFVNSDIVDLINNTDVVFTGPVTLDWLTLCRCVTAPHLDHFLLRAGMPEVFVRYSIDCAKSMDKHMLSSLLYSTFISHGGPDRRFAERLRDILIYNGVRTFLFSRDAIPGQPLHKVMRDGVAAHDRIIVVCSEVSLDRPGVQNEIELTLRREAREGGKAYLIPVILDDYLFHWKPNRFELAQELRDRVVADFRGAEDDELMFKQGITDLLRALRRSTQ
jgi:uncharacterized protein YjbI with pentapeptide repeats